MDIKCLYLFAHVFGLGVVLSCTLILIGFFVVSFFNCFVFTTNSLCEFWPEVGVFVLGLLCFLGTYNKIRIGVRSRCI